MYPGPLRRTARSNIELIISVWAAVLAEKTWWVIDGWWSDRVTEMELMEGNVVRLSRETIGWA